MRAYLFVAALLLSTRMLFGGSIPIWPGQAPGALGSGHDDTARIEVLLPQTPDQSGAAMVICPGGSFHELTRFEGNHYGRFLNNHGIAAFVLHYRLPEDGYSQQDLLNDAARAVRYVRSRSAEWKVDPTRVGIMGSSAGGYVAASLLTGFDSGDPLADDPVERWSSRPDLGVLCYPVITVGVYGERYSKQYLLGKNPSPALVAQLSTELHVTTNTPPCFIWHTYPDRRAPVENSLLFAEALRDHGVPFDLHIYSKGAHGIGLGSRTWAPEAHHPWTRQLVYWLGTAGWISTTAPQRPLEEAPPLEPNLD